MRWLKFLPIHFAITLNTQKQNTWLFFSEFLRLQSFNITLFLTSICFCSWLWWTDREILQLFPVSSCSFSFFWLAFCFGLFCFKRKSSPPYQIFIVIFNAAPCHFSSGMKPSQITNTETKLGFFPLPNFISKLTKDFHQRKKNPCRSPH